MEDPTLTKISLHEKQRLAFYSPATELLFGGAAGPGKSLGLRISGIRWCQEVPGIQVYLFRRTFPDLRDNHLRGPTSFFVLLGDLIDQGLVRYNKQDNEFVWLNTNSRIRLCHAQHEDDVLNYQGSEIHVLLIDELTHFTEFQYRFLRGRVRCVGIKIPEKYRDYLPRVENASNPGSEGHGWVKRTFIKNLIPLNIYQQPKQEGGMLRQFIPARMEDNPDLLRDDPLYEARLDGLGSPDLVRAMKSGDWDIFAGQFFDMWRRDIHILPAEFPIPDHWNRFYAYDHGYSHPAAFGAFAVDEQARCYLFKEVVLVRKHVPEIAEAIFEALGETEFKRIKNVNAGHDVFYPGRDGGPSVFEKFEKLPKERKILMVHAKLDRVQGATHVREYLFWKSDEEGRIIGPSFFVKENCTRTIDCLPSLVHDPNNGEDVLKLNGTESDPFGGDDPYDMVRYGLMSRPRAPKVEQPFIPLSYDERVKLWLDKKRIRLSKKSAHADPVLGRSW
jgi:hypothetical protein